MQPIDSLKGVFKSANHDSIRGRLMDEISYIFYSYELDSSIYYAKLSGEYAKKCGDQKMLAQSYNSVGVCLINKSALMSAMDYFNNAYVIYSNIKDAAGEAKMLNNLGVIYSDIGEYEKAIQKFQLSWQINIQLQRWDVASHALFNISINETYLHDLDNALIHAQELQRFFAEHNDVVHPAPLFAQIFIERNILDSAKYYAEIAISQHAIRGETYFMISSRLTLADILIQLGDLVEAGKLITYCSDEITINNLVESKIQLLPIRSKYLSLLGRFEEAYVDQNEYQSLKDSIDSANKMNMINDLSARYELTRMESEIASQDIQITENKTWIGMFILIALILSVGLVAVVIFLKRNRRLNQILKTQNAQINIQRQKIISSITYAKKIQQSALPKEKDFKSLFKEAFIYFKPKDIISGDFYAYQIIDNKTYVAAIDCTGHGVPGAFMSLIANAKLNRVVNELKERDPGKILAAMHHEIQISLQQETNEDNAQDGLEMSLCVIDRLNHTIEFAGAGSSIMLMKDNELVEYKGTALGLGGNLIHSERPGRNFKFETQIISFTQNDMLMMYSDGFHDQIGGEENKKLNKGKFKDFIKNLNISNLHKASELSESFINNWKGNHPQTDDIMLIGIRL